MTTENIERNTECQRVRDNWLDTMWLMLNRRVYQYHNVKPHTEKYYTSSCKSGFHSPVSYCGQIGTREHLKHTKHKTLTKKNIKLFN